MAPLKFILANRNVTEAKTTLSRLFSELCRKINIPIHAVVRFAIYVWDKLKASAQWITNIPHRVINFVARIGQAIGRAAVFAVKVVLSLTVSVVLLGLIIQGGCIMWPVYKEWRRKVKAQRAYEEQERVYLLKDAERRRQAQRQFERARKEEEERLERARKEEEDRLEKLQREREARERKVEEDKKRQQAAMALQREEDARKFRTWRTDCNKVFQLYGTSFTPFPEPPHWPCNKDGCTSRHRYLEACEHSLHRLFEATGDLQTTLEAERWRWHPNGFTGAKFHLLKNNSHEVEFANKAVELSQVLKKLIDAEKDK